MRLSMQRGARGTRSSSRNPGFWAGCLLSALVFVSPIAYAHDPAAAPVDPGPWSGDVRLGYLANSGNTETENVNFAFGVDYAIDRWTHGVTGSAVGASTDDETSAEAYTLGWRSAYDLSERDNVFGRVDWLKDRFSGYDQQLSQSVGYGRRLIVQPHQKLSVEIGPGARQSELRNGEELKETIVRVGANYEYLFNESAQLNFDLGVKAGEDNTFTEGVLALKTKLMGDLSAVLGYTVRNNTDVPDGSDKTDTMTAVSLEYSF